MKIYEIGKPGEVEPAKILTVVKEAHECSGFVEWQNGFSPKEHLEMQLQERQAADSRQREADQRTWQAEQARLQREWQEGQNGITNRNTWITWLIAACAVLGTVFGPAIRCWLGFPP